MNVDAAGVVHETGNALNKVASRANAPIFTYDDFYFDGAIVGGPMFSMHEGSRTAATVATRILDGEKASDIKTPPMKYASPKFDWRQMQRWGISESNLPPGSSIHFRPPTAWETYRWQIVAVCAVAATSSAFSLGCFCSSGGGVIWQKWTPGNGWWNWPMSIAFRQRANCPHRSPTKSINRWARF